MTTAARQDGTPPSTHSDKEMAGWIDHLRTLWPPRGLVHVGVGDSTMLDAYANWHIAKVVLTDADAGRASRASERAAAHDGWQAHHVLIDEADRIGRFFVVSNPSESGLLPAEMLHGLWRNLCGSSEQSMNAATLDVLLGDQRSAVNWLIVDCLPAATILRGARELLDECDVVLARAALDGTGPEGMGASAGEVASLLEERGFFALVVEEELNPLVGRVLFARDHARSRIGDRRELAELRSSLAQAMRRADEAEHDATAVRQSSAIESGSLQRTVAELETEVGRLRLRVIELETEADRALQEFEHRLTAANADKRQFELQIARAEAQIVLIRDLLLR